MCGLELMTRLGCLQSPWDHSSLWKQFSFSDASWSSNSWPERSAFIPQESWSVIWLLSKEMAGFISWSLSLMLQVHVSHACCGRTGLWQQTELQTPFCWSDSSTPKVTVVRGRHQLALHTGMPASPLLGENQRSEFSLIYSTISLDWKLGSEIQLAYFKGKYLLRGRKFQAISQIVHFFIWIS